MQVSVGYDIKAWKLTSIMFEIYKGEKFNEFIPGPSKRPGVGFGRGREFPNLAGAGNWLFWDLAGAGAVNFIILLRFKDLGGISQF